MGMVVVLGMLLANQDTELTQNHRMVVVVGADRKREG